VLAIDAHRCMVDSRQAVAEAASPSTSLDYLTPAERIVEIADSERENRRTAFRNLQSQVA